MKTYGLRGTFNVNSGLFANRYNGVEKGQMTRDEALKLYVQEGIEVAIHGYQHISLAKVEPSFATFDVINDRKELECMFGKVIKGMAYANGSIHENAINILKTCGISYARTIDSTESFDLPETWLRMNPTCHHNNPKLMELVEQFLKGQEEEYFWDRKIRLFYLWGHSWEFD